MKLNNQVAVITGGNSGIGKATVKLFLQQGAKVVVADLAAQLDDELSELGADIAYIQTNVVELASVEKMIAFSLEKFGAFHILVNSAGVLGPRTRTDKYPETDFDNVMAVNVKGVWNGMKVALNHFLAQKQGTIVNIASVAGHLGMVGHIAYSASKHAVIGMTKTAGIEYAKAGIRINAVCPGFTQTPMLEGADTEDAYLEALKQATPMKRFGKPEEIAQAILYLANDDSSFMTGQSMILDGGLILQ